MTIIEKKCLLFKLITINIFLLYFLKYMKDNDYRIGRKLQQKNNQKK